MGNAEWNCCTSGGKTETEGINVDDEHRPEKAAVRMQKVMGSARRDPNDVTEEAMEYGPEAWSHIAEATGPIGWCPQTEAWAPMPVARREDTVEDRIDPWARLTESTCV
jgi:hypothetical protein